MWPLLTSALVSWVWAANEPQPGYGFVGPSCTIVDGTLFLHGVARRILSKEEANSFLDYQRQLSLFALGSSEQLDAPLVPDFCNGLDDSVEVVLSSCIVRNNHVYEGDRLVRPLTNREKQRLATAISRRSRSRRALDPGMDKQRDFSALIHKFLNVNSSVTSRFLPVVSQSPLFSMDGALESVLGGGKKEETTTTEQPMTTSTLPVTKATFKPLTKTTFTRVTPTVATVDVPAQFPAVEIEETVRDPILLQLIAQALEKNQLLDNLLLPASPLAQTSVPFHAQPPVESKTPINLKIVPPTISWQQTPTVLGPIGNVPFSPHLSFTSLGGSEAFPNRRRKPANKYPSGLPDDICSNNENL